MKLMKMNYGKLVGLALRIDCDESYFSDMDSFYSNPMAFSIQITANILYTAINVEMSKPVHITALQYESCDSDQAIRIILYIQEGIPVVGFRDAVEKVLDQEDVWVPLPTSLEIVLMHAYHSCLQKEIKNISKSVPAPEEQKDPFLENHPYRGAIRSKSFRHQKTPTDIKEPCSFYRLNTLGEIFSLSGVDGTVVKQKNCSHFTLITNAFLEEFLEPDDETAEILFDKIDLFQVVIPSIAEAQN